jgi:hypothetical protein
VTSIVDFAPLLVAAILAAMGRRIGEGVVLLLIGAGLTLLVQQIDRWLLPNPPPATITKRFIPPTGELGSWKPKILNITQGKCTRSGSISDPERATAHLCRVSAGIDDPCFVNRLRGRAGLIGRANYLCFPYPWFPPPSGEIQSPVAFGIILDGWLPSIRHREDHKFRAWLLELANGRLCTRISANLQIWEPDDAKYRCERRTPRGDAIDGWVSDFPSDEDPVWYVPFVLRGKEAEGSTPIRIERARY